MPVSSLAPISVAIHSAVLGPAGIGEEVTLIADVPEGYAVQWQYSADGGITAADIEGAVFSTYTFVLTEENMDYLYRVRVTRIVAADDQQ